MNDWLQRDHFIFVGWRLVHMYNLCYLMVYPWVGYLAHSLLLLWGPEAQGDFTHWCQLGGLWDFVALHGAFGLLGKYGWFFAPSFGTTPIFRFILFFKGFHNWMLNDPF
ncbi:hypothetical protein MKX03_011764 [Papaver bracteatum]|nr:hypothetical protein MKX03_011764 [Papaver bracteatum]